MEGSGVYSSVDPGMCRLVAGPTRREHQSLRYPQLGARPVDFKRQVLRSAGFVFEIVRLADSNTKLRVYSVAATGGVSDKVTNLYSALDDWMKISKFSHNLEKGMDEYEPGVDARKATIDYHNVPKVVDWLRRGPLPFIIFPTQALPRPAKSAIEAPWRLASIALAIAMYENYARKQVGVSKEERG
jgi:hypothetical protein